MDKLKRVLVVDDDKATREGLQEILKAFGYEVETASDGLEALAKIELDIDLALLDVEMPGMDGFEVAKRIRESASYQELPIIMVTGMSSRQDRIRAVEAGVNDFIAKPIDSMEIRVRTNSLLQMKEAYDQLKRHKLELEETVAKRTASLRKALDDVVSAQRNLRTAHLETIQHLVAAAEFKDMDTANHIKRMSQFSAMIGRKIGLPPHEVELLLHASPMHDIGKIATPEKILLKPGKLDEKEWDVMRMHSEIGGQILRDATSDLLHAGEIIARYHHEKWDGSGYPRGLTGEDIPLWGRICAVADVFDALTSKRPYKEAFSNEKALEILWEGRNNHFDPKLVDVFIEGMDEVVKIQKDPSRPGA